MSQPDNILSIEECFSIIRRWQKDGPTEEERDGFVTKASDLLTDSDAVNEFLARVSEAANLAKAIESVFAQNEGLLLLWFLSPLVPEWDALWDRFRSCVRYSCDIALNTMSILQRFDAVYLAQVETIQTEQDRQNAIAALEPFIAELETTDISDELSRQFLDLKRDIEYFGQKYSVFSEKNAIIPLTSDIEALDAQITAAQNAIGVLGGGALLRVRNHPLRVPKVITDRIHLGPWAGCKIF
ncbi:hypothetical protein EST38_g4257 [Candolleomyces aberdarensis]|uniref:Uncharacterized protein n=1 Tax=Candolleomyces aberdarensis TaxID=2316362 RepID=A0A4Q2DNH1_9AGAR|nr:hypothetical protein EST38_g4257 [Candolleomyces aberdarensis]